MGGKKGKGKKGKKGKKKGGADVEADPKEKNCQLHAEIEALSHKLILE